MTEAPFLPREKLFKQQQYFQNLTKHTHLKGRYDVITSVGIPLALAASSLFLIGRGIYNMSHGIGKKSKFQWIFASISALWLGSDALKAMSL